MQSRAYACPRSYAAEAIEDKYTIKGDKEAQKITKRSYLLVQSNVEPRKLISFVA